MVIKLDLKDKRILFELDRNSRQSLIGIAKKVRMSKEAVYYRIKQLEDRKIITGYTILISLAKLGLMQIKLLIKFQNVTKIKKGEIIEYLKNHKNTNWVASCTGNYDLIAGFVVKNLREFYDIKNIFLQRYSQYLLFHDLSIMIEAQVYGRKHLLNQKQEIKYYVGESEKIKFDNLDLEILKLLAENTRIKMIEIAGKLNVTARIVNYRIKQLEKNKVIQKYILSLNHRLLGIFYFKLFIYLNRDNEKLLEYLVNQNNCVYNVESLANWNFEPEFEVYSNEEGYNILEELEENFGGSIKTINTILITKEHKFELLPEIKLK